MLFLNHVFYSHVIYLEINVTLFGLEEKRTLPIPAFFGVKLMYNSVYDNVCQKKFSFKSSSPQRNTRSCSNLTSEVKLDLEGKDGNLI